jgi:hypothetical protein
MFKPFQWVAPGAVGPLPADIVLDSLGQIRDLTAGARVLVEMLERDELKDALPDGGRLFHPADRGDLLRLVIAASRAAAESADDVMQWASEHHGKGA